MGRQPAKIPRNTSGIIRLLFLCISIFGAAQNVTLSRVLHSSDDRSKILYRISPDNPASQLLGEVEVIKSGISLTDLYAEFYKKAKQIGANSFSADEGNPGTVLKISLYYTPQSSIPAETNTFYLLASDGRIKKISVNGKTIELLPQSYIRIRPAIGTAVTVSTRQLLGSSVKLAYAQDQPARYFLISSARVSENPDGSPGLRLKSGDITGLERSYAEFLMIGRQEESF